MTKFRFSYHLFTWLCCFLALVPTLLAQQSGKPGIGLTMAIRQSGSPLELISATSTREYMFEEVRVKNVSDKDVVAVGFSAMLHFNNPKMKSILLEGRPVPTHLKPQEERVVQALVVSAKVIKEKVDAFRGIETLAELGVTNVEFSDGTLWTYDPLASGGFQMVNPPSQQADRADCTTCAKEAAESTLASVSSITRRGQTRVGCGSAAFLRDQSGLLAFCADLRSG